MAADMYVHTLSFFQVVGTIEIEANRVERNRAVAERDACLEASDYKRAHLLNKKPARLYR